MFKKIVISGLILLCGCIPVFSKQNPDELKAKLKELRNSENFTKASIQHVKLLVELGNSLKYSQTDTVKFLAVESLELSRLINYEKGKFESLLNFGYFELFTGNPDKAAFYYKQSLDGALLNKFTNLAIKSYNGIAQSHFIKAEYPSAFVNFQNALELAKEIDDSEMFIKMSANLGTLFSILEDYDEAIPYYALAQSKFNENTTIIAKVSVLVNLGYLYNKIKEPVKAMGYLDKSIDLLQEVQAAKILAFAYLTKGDVYNQLGNYNEALSMFNKANVIHREINDKKGEADLHFYSGTSYTKLNNQKNAEEAFLKSLELYQSFNLKSGLEKSYRALYTINKNKGNISKALSYLELARKYSDSISKEKQRSTISMMNAKLSYEKNKAAIIEQNEIELNERRKYIAWITIGIISSIIISILLLRAANTKKRLNTELELQTSILAKKQKELNIINDNQDKLFSIIGHDLRGPIVSLKNLLGASLKKKKEIKHFYTFGPKLKKDVDHIHFTLDNLLNWGLTQMKGNTTKKETIFVAEHLSEIIHFFKEDSDKKNISIKLALPSTLKLSVDPNHFDVIFKNLISNAIKFTPKNGSIFIDSNTIGNDTAIYVKDTGVGMTNDTIKRIFNDKEHFTTAGTNKEHGSGLGLNLCKELVKHNNGFISVKSEVGTGSIFTVHFRSNTATS